MAQRKLSPVNSTTEITTLLGKPQPNALPAPQMGVTSSYFGLQAEVFIGSGRLALYSVIFRPGGGGTPVVLAHSTNTQ
jgi:general secretion pathway protein K